MNEYMRFLTEGTRVQKFYHASPDQGLKVLDPTKTQSTHLKEIKPYVYVSDSRAYAAGFCFQWSDNEGFQHGSNSKMGDDWIIKIPRRFADRLKTSCSLYTITDNGFRKVYSVPTPEFYKSGRVRIAKEEKYKTALDCLKDNRVTVKFT
jgi:hypothetical protein